MMKKVIILGQGTKGKTIADQCAIQNVSVSVCGWCGNKLCDSQKFNNTCFKCGKSPYSKQTER